MADETPPRLPPGQKITEKFPVMTAGNPNVAAAADWDFVLEHEDEAGARETLARWSYAAFRALPQSAVTADIHCVTRWSKLDTRWSGVLIDDLLTAAGAPLGDDGYAQIHAEAGYSANLRRRDLRGANAFIALDYDGAPLPEPHGGPARLVVPKLYFWKSAKWVRRLTLSPYDHKGYWEKLGYHNYGDPWLEQRYRGVPAGAADDESQWRRTLDPELSAKVRAERLAAKRKGEA